MQRSRAAAVAVVLAAVVAVAATHVAVADWTTAGADGRNTGVAVGADVVDGPVERWRVDAVGSSVASPVVDDARVYIADAGTVELGERGAVGEGGVVAIDRDDGSTVWRTDLGSAVLASPTLSGGSLYVGTAAGRFYELDARTGEVLTERRVGGPVTDAVRLAGEIAMVVVRSDARDERWFERSSGGAFDVVGIDLRVDEQRWRRSLEGWVPGAPAVALGRVWVPTVDGVTALGVSRGREATRIDVEGRLRAGPVVRDGVVYVGDAGGVLAADATTGRRIWRHRGHVPRRDGLAVTPDRVVAVTRGGTVHALHAGTGRLNWSRGGFEGELSGPSIDGRSIFVRATENVGETVAAVARNDGGLRWRRDIASGNVTGWLENRDVGVPVIGRATPEDRSLYLAQLSGAAVRLGEEPATTGDDADEPRDRRPGETPVGPPLGADGAGSGGTAVERPTTDASAVENGSANASTTEGTSSGGNLLVFLPVFAGLVLVAVLTLGYLALRRGERRDGQ